MKIEDANPHNIKNDLLHNFFENGNASVLFRNMDTGRWKAYTIFSLHEKGYRVRIAEGEHQKVRSGYSANISERTVETLIHIGVKGGEYQRVLLRYPCHGL